MDDHALGYSRSLGWEVFNATIQVTAWIVTAGLLLLTFAVVGVVCGARRSENLRKSSS